MLSDLRFAVRQLRKSPGIAALAIVTLAFGIGPNAAMFAVVDSVFARPLPYPHADRLVYVGPQDAKGYSSTAWLNFRDIQDQSKALEAVGAFSQDIGVVQGTDGSISVVTPGVTPSLLTMLGARPLLGRTFSEQEGQRGGPKAVLLSEGMWRQVFAADPDILSRTIRVNGQSRRVVGVMARSFRFPEQIGRELEKGLWLPLQPTNEMLTDRGYNLFLIVGRLRPDATLAQANAELAAIAARIRAADAKAGSKLAFRATPYQEMLTGPVGPVFLALAIALGLVLLIACVNVANLLIARCLVRRHEFAVRAALGAGRGRLVRQLLVEGALLSALGCGLGLALAMLAIAAVKRLPPDTIPRGDEIAVRWTIVLLLAAISTLTTVISAVLPALLAARSDPQQALQGASRTASRSIRNRLSESLVAGEVALSAVLLIATGLLFHTLWNLERARLGFDVARITTLTAMPADASGFGNMAVSEDTGHAPASVAVTVYAPVLERLRSLPGVQDAALVTAPPFSGIGLHSSFEIVGRPDDREHDLGARITAVSGGYAALMSTPVVRGRMITDDDTESAPPVAVINETLARKYFAAADPIGVQLDLGGKTTGMIRPLTIVGVIGDQVDTSAAQPTQPLLMIAYRQIPTTSLFYQALVKTIVNLAVKTRGDVAVAAAARAVFRELAPDYALDNVQTLQEAVDRANFNQRLGLYLTAAFAGLAMVMVIAGLYGVLAQVVSLRRREFGIRLALGATPSAILAMVLREASVLIAIGLACGVAIAVAGGSLVQSFLYQVRPADAVTYAAVVLLLLLVGTLAALVPAQRAASVQPVQTLREQ